MVAEGGHTWSYGAGLWRCTRCMRLTLSGTIGREQFMDKCPGPKDSLEAKVIESKGHVLAKSPGDVTVIFCIKCGAFAARRAYGLAARCPGRPTPAGKQALGAKGRRRSTDRRSAAHRWHGALAAAATWERGRGGGRRAEGETAARMAVLALMSTG